jgi:hypothetical protein
MELPSRSERIARPRERVALPAGTEACRPAAFVLSVQAYGALTEASRREVPTQQEVNPVLGRVQASPHAIARTSVSALWATLEMRQRQTAGTTSARTWQKATR